MPYIINQLAFNPSAKKQTIQLPQNTHILGFKQTEEQAGQVLMTVLHHSQPTSQEVRQFESFATGEIFQEGEVDLHPLSTGSLVYLDSFYYYDNHYHVFERIGNY